MSYRLLGPLKGGFVFVPISLIALSSCSHRNLHIEGREFFLGGGGCIQIVKPPLATGLMVAMNSAKAFGFCFNFCQFAMFHENINIFNLCQSYYQIKVSISFKIILDTGLTGKEKPQTNKQKEWHKSNSIGQEIIL